MLNTVIEATKTTTEMNEDTFARISLSKNLISYIFNKLQRKSGGN
jgi:hypothetical protein